MSLLKTTIKPKLPPGEYPVQIVTFREVANEKGGYIELTINMPDRLIKQNFFPSQLSYLGSTVGDQLGLRSEEHDLEEILTIAKNKDLFAIISYNDYGMNLAFHKPVVASKADEVDFQ